MSSTNYRLSARATGKGGGTYATRLVVLPEGNPHVLLGGGVVRAELELERLGRLPCMVVGDLGAKVVRNVGLGDAVHEVRSDGAHHVAVDRAERSSLEVPLAGAVVGEDGVGVLEVRDHH